MRTKRVHSMETGEECEGNDASSEEKNYRSIKAQVKTRQWPSIALVRGKRHTMRLQPQYIDSCFG